MAQTAPVLAPHEPSICIPFVEKSFNDGQVIEGIQQLGYGEVEKVDMIHKTTYHGKEYYMTFVHFKKWNTDEETTKQRDAFMRGEKQKVVYDEDTGAYWLLRQSYSKRPEDRNKYEKVQSSRNGKSKKGPYVDKEGWSTIPKKYKSKSNSDAANSKLKQEFKRSVGDEETSGVTKTNSFYHLDNTN